MFSDINQFVMDGVAMEKYVLYFNEIDKTFLSYVGGKGANLGEMTKAGFPVPQGFCVTTWAYRTMVEKSSEINALFEKLEGINSDNFEGIAKLGQSIREHINSIFMPEDIKAAILNAWEVNGKDKAYAVRSSATAEDLPTASFAGQQDTYLNICGSEQLLKAIQNCWASLFTDRAISYRAKNNFDHRAVFLSVVVQEMVFPEVSGIMFTADPITGRRKTVSIDASFGLGEALVSGLVTADLYQVRSGKITKKQIGKKKIAICSLQEGGTITEEIPLEKQEVQALVDERIIELAALAQRIEAHYGTEQDIEWGFVNGRFYILQSRPITSLYPITPASDDKFRVYISFGHIQMMTDTMKPLAISIMSNVPNFIKEQNPSSEDNIIKAFGSRAFADITGALLLKPSRNMLLKVSGGMDEAMSAALREVIEREEFLKLSMPKKKVFQVGRKMAPIIIPIMSRVAANLFFKNPRKAKNSADKLIEKLVKEAEKYMSEASGAEKILRVKESMGIMFPKVLSKVAVYLMAGVLASLSLEKKMKKQLGDKQSAHLLSQLNKSLPGNVTTELGLELGDLADTARKYPEVIDYLEKAKNENFYAKLIKVQGSLEFEEKLKKFLEKYGMRCAGEIDITKPRWKEDPTQLIPSIISNIRTTAPGEHREKFKQGVMEAEKAEKEILSQFGGFSKRRIAHLIKLYRNLMGMREHHKFVVVRVLDIYKDAILEEARGLVEKGVLKQEQDVYYLTLEELVAAIENSYLEKVQEIVEERKKQLELNEKRNPPRVMTGEGEIITGKQRKVKAPEGALIGTPVSAGMVEGVARVILKLEDAKLNPGEILVAPYTDPAWTPLFTSAVGLITEVGGMMTHGSVVAREYGIPAVVGIEKVTEIIKDGLRIRVNGTEGYIEILGEDKHE
ncbi:MAG: phosphoenolpyruvate synthase [Clostridia bacterium]|nr:phosphoenolpyruvate synthase [Clostridia bacterium]